MVASSEYTFPVEYTKHLRIATNLFGTNKEWHLFRQYMSRKEYAERYVAGMLDVGDLELVRNAPYPNIWRYIRFYKSKD